MGAKNDWSSLKGRLAGKWQIPLLAAALALFAATVYRRRLEIPRAPTKRALSHHHISTLKFPNATSDAQARIGRAGFDGLGQNKSLIQDKSDEQGGECSAVTTKSELART